MEEQAKYEVRSSLLLSGIKNEDKIVEFIGSCKGYKFALVPVADYMIIRLREIKPREVTKSGIYVGLVEDNNEKKTLTWDEYPIQGVILSVGEQEKKYKAGDYVYLSRLPRYDFIWNDEWFSMIQACDILGILNLES